MPRFNGTGPEGKGSQTGRGLGKCNPKTNESTQSTKENTESFELGRRNGRGMGNGRAIGNGRAMGNKRGMGRRS